MGNKQITDTGRVESLMCSIQKKIHSIPTKQKFHKDITFAQLKILMFLASGKAAPMTAVAKSQNVTLPTATGLVNTLVANGYLKRHHQPADRRQVFVELSIKANTLLEDLNKSQRERYLKIRKSISKTNWTKFVAALKTIDEILKPEN